MSRIFTLFNFLLITFLAIPAFAADAVDPNAGIKAFSAAFAISVAAFGGALGQGRAAAAAWCAARLV